MACVSLQVAVEIVAARLLSWLFVSMQQRCLNRGREMKSLETDEGELAFWMGKGWLPEVEDLN
jgi:hypothetical protein